MQVGRDSTYDLHVLLILRPSATSLLLPYAAFYHSSSGFSMSLGRMMASTTYQV
jgi:hypothetical protein